jgi:hypothetical protein
VIVRIRAGKRCGSHQKRGRKDHGQRADPTFHMPPLSALALTASPDARVLLRYLGRSKALSGSRRRCHSCAPSRRRKSARIEVRSGRTSAELRHAPSNGTNVAQPPAGRRAPPVRAPHVRDASDRKRRRDFGTRLHLLQRALSLPSSPQRWRRRGDLAGRWLRRLFSWWLVLVKPAERHCLHVQGDGGQRSTGWSGTSVECGPRALSVADRSVRTAWLQRVRGS